MTKLLTDITQVQCRDGKLYISPIMDCFNGEIIALCMRNNMKKELCIDTVKAAASRFPVRDAILHSDRGSQYTSEAFRSELARQGLTQSLSRMAHCYDNARMESFFATLKKDLTTRFLHIASPWRKSNRRCSDMCSSASIGSGSIRPIPAAGLRKPEERYFLRQAA